MIARAVARGYARMRRVVTAAAVVAVIAVGWPGAAGAGVVVERGAPPLTPELASALALLRAELERGGELVAHPAAVAALLAPAAGVPGVVEPTGAAAPLRERARALREALVAAHARYLRGDLEGAAPRLAAALSNARASPALVVDDPALWRARLDALAALADCLQRRAGPSAAGDVLAELRGAYPVAIAELRRAYGPALAERARLVDEEVRARGRGRLRVALDAPGARVFVDEAPVAWTRGGELDVAAGRRRVLVVPPAGPSRAFGVDVPRGGVATLAVRWAQAAAVTIGARRVSVEGVTDAAAARIVGAVVAQRGHLVVVVVSLRDVDGVPALRASVHRGRDGGAVRAHEILLDGDVGVRIQALARAVRLGARARDPAVRAVR